MRLSFFCIIQFVVLASNVQAKVQEQALNHTGKTNDSMDQLADNLVNKLIDKLFNQVLKPSPAKTPAATGAYRPIGRPGNVALPRRSFVPRLTPWKSPGSSVLTRTATEPKKDAMDEIVQDLSEGQLFGPTKPAHQWDKPWTNLHKQEPVQKVKAASGQLKEPLKTELGNDEIFITGDAVHIMKHHGSYMQQNRLLKGIERKSSYQFMLRLKVPCGEMPGPIYAELDDLADKYGQGDLRATTRQAFQLHGVLKGNLKTVISTLANLGSGTLGGCGDINRNIMTPPVKLANDPAYGYSQQYARAIAELFAPQSDAFSELWLDGKQAMTTAYYTQDIGEFNVEKVRVEDRGNGIITGHPSEPLYGRTYLPKKFKIAITVPGDNSVDIYTNDIGAVVIMNEDGKTLDGFDIMVGGGMGRTHGKAITSPFAASHLGYVPKEEFFEAMKAILAAQRDHGNREVRPQARLKYLVNTLGIDEFRKLVEKYYGQKFEPWKPLPEWKYLDWMGWHEQGDGNLMFGMNIEQGRVRDTEEVQMKSALRKMVDTFPGVDLILTPAQSVVFRDIKPADKQNVEVLLKSHGVKMIEDVDPITRKSMACPAFPLCGLAMTEAERVQPQINQRIWKMLNDMGLADDPATHLMTRTTGCPNGCTRPYMAEMALVGSGPGMYQVWLGGSPAMAERTAFESHLFKMKLDDLEKTFTPIFQMYKDQREKGEAFGDFCHRVGKEAIEKYCTEHTPA
jgi:sulfite reductase (ferredoxin)